MTYPCRVARGAALLVLVVAVAACSGRGPGRAIEVDVDLQSGQAWSAHGSAVDGRLMCAAGGRQTIEIRDIDGVTALTTAEAVSRIEEAAASGEPGRLTFVVEMTCADGSGTITLIEHPTSDTWEVVGGTGAYGGLVGGGSFVVEDFDAATVEEPSPDDPPDGAPHSLHLTGDLWFGEGEE